MKIKNSLRTAKIRHKDCRLVRRRGRVYVINKTIPRFKVRQGLSWARSMPVKSTRATLLPVSCPRAGNYVGP